MALFGKRQVDAQVSAMNWTRVVQLDRLRWVSKRGSWAPDEGARNVEKHTETYWEMVTDTTPGVPGANGIPGPSSTSTRMVPQVRVYYTYEALEWHKSRTLRAEGAGPVDVAWPEYTLEPGERVGDRQETYQATFTAGDKRYTTSLPEQEWRALEAGLSCRLALSLFGGVKKVTRLP